jgi:uncharacterized RDD family membrane protein YckC
VQASLDTLYAVETPEGIHLSLRPAGLVVRLQAYLIDFAIKIGLYIAASIVAGFMGGIGVAFYLIAYFCLEWLYPVVFELMRGGATPGKRSMGLTVVMDSGLPVTPAASVIRNLLRVADFFPMLYAVGAMVVLWRPDFKRLGDLAAGTLVVYQDAVVLHKDLPAATPLAPARTLEPREQAAIVAWAGRAQSLTPQRLEELAKLASAVLPASKVDELADAFPNLSQPTALTERLLGVAQWLLGRRGGGAP